MTKSRLKILKIRYTVEEGGLKIEYANAGFSLLEMMATIIIVMILAGLALPKFFKTIEFARSKEAFEMIGTIHHAVVRCGHYAAGDYTNCVAMDFSDLDISDPNMAVGSHFSYTIEAIMAGMPPLRNYIVIATRNTLDGGDGVSEVRMSVNDATGTIVRSGTGVYESIH